MARLFEPCDVERLEAAGATLQNLPAIPKGFQLFPGRARISALATKLRKLAPHALIAIAAPNVAEVLLAAKKARIPRSIALIDDLRTDDSAQLKRALELADVAVFGNEDHPKALRARGQLPSDLAYCVVPGTGVDLLRYASAPLPPFGTGLTFLMMANRNRARHLETFATAARLLKARAPAARFLYALDRDAGADTIAITPSHRETVELIEVGDDSRAAIAECHVFVYLSDGEGMPSAVLQALAMGRPIVTTDTPGCRDTVDDKVNGCLVAPADPTALAAALQSFLKRPDMIPHLARASRAKAERRFDAKRVNATLMELLRL